jgi:hypothetical protein
MVTDKGVAAVVVPARPTMDLTPGECWRLLAGTSLGRIVFTQHAMPAVRPVNHIVDDKTIIIRSHLGAAIVGRAGAGADVGPGACEGSVVCYEADEIDPERHTGWSVIVTGMARLVRDPAAVARYERLLQPWAEGQMDYVIAIEPRLVTGLRLVGWCH